MRRFPFLVVATAMLLAAPASSAGLRPWIGMSGSWGTYKMDDINSYIATLDDSLGETSLWLWQMKSGPGVEVTAGADFGRGHSLGFGFERIYASSCIEGEGYFDKFRFPAHAWRAFGEYAFPHRGSIGARLGVAGGIVTETGSVSGIITEAGAFASWRDNGVPAVIDVAGSGPLFETWLGADWWGNPRCAITGSLGYRYARIAKVEFDDQPGKNRDGSDFKLDYSGAFARLGFRVMLGPTATAEANPSSPSETTLGPWVGATGSWGPYKMGDVNDDITSFNERYGAGVEEISGGFGFGGTIGVDLPHRLAVGAGYERVLASTEDSSVPLTYDHAANAYRLFCEWRVMDKGVVTPRIGIAGGTIMEAGSVEVGLVTIQEGAAAAAAESSDGTNLEGSGPLVEVYAGGDWRLSSRLALVTTVGYRYAKIGELRAGDEVLLKDDASRYTVDYSGLRLSLGLRLALAK